jgi:intraflagellar transport protein 140
MQGTVKHTIGFTDAEGDPLTLDIMGNFLVVTTSKMWIKTWDIARREPRQHNPGRAFEDDAGKPIGNITSARINANGTSVSIICTRYKEGGPMTTAIPDTRLHVWHCEFDKITAYDFVDRRFVHPTWGGLAFRSPHGT